MMRRQIMINIDRFDCECLDKLRSRTKINLPKYLERNDYWLPEEVKELGYEVINSNLNVDEIVFDMSNADNPSATDFANAIKLHKSLNISPEIAANGMFWTVLSHHYIPYLRYRYKLENQNTDTQVDRIENGFIFSEMLTKRERRKGILPRLWMIALLTFDPSETENGYGLTKCMLSEQDLAQSILDRTIFMNKTIVKSFLRNYRDRESSGDPMTRKEVRSLMTYLDALSDVTVLESLDEDDLKKQMKKHEEWYKTKN